MSIISLHMTIIHQIQQQNTGMHLQKNFTTVWNANCCKTRNSTIDDVPCNARVQYAMVWLKPKNTPLPNVLPRRIWSFFVKGVSINRGNFHSRGVQGICPLGQEPGWHPRNKQLPCMCLSRQIWLFCIIRCRQKYREPPKLESAGLRCLWLQTWLTPKNKNLPICVNMSNLVLLHQIM